MRVGEISFNEMMMFLYSLMVTVCNGYKLSLLQVSIICNRYKVGHFELNSNPPSLVCDFQESYRYLIDDFVIQYCQSLAKRDFTHKTEKLSTQKKGKRQYLNDTETKEFTKKLSNYFETSVEIPRIRVGERQTLETLINEEAYLFAKFLRNERKEWHQRIPKV